MNEKEKILRWQRELMLVEFYSRKDFKEFTREMIEYLVSFKFEYDRQLAFNRVQKLILKKEYSIIRTRRRNLFSLSVFMQEFDKAIKKRGKKLFPYSQRLTKK